MPATDDDLQDIYNLLADATESYATGDYNRAGQKTRMAKELVQGLHGDTDG